MIWWIDLFQVELQQPFVDGAQVTLRQVTVIDELSIHTGQLINGLLEVLIADGVLLQEGMALWVKEATVEGCHAQWRAAFVDDAKERL